MPVFFLSIHWSGPIEALALNGHFEKVRKLSGRCQALPVLLSPPNLIGLRRREPREIRPIKTYKRMYTGNQSALDILIVENSQPHRMGRGDSLRLSANHPLKQKRLGKPDMKGM